MEYYINSREIDNRLIFVLGASRSGKSLFSKILGTAKNAYWCTEPYMISQVVLLSGHGIIPPQISKECLRAAMYEYINDIVLMRGANFRPNDMSAIWDTKDVRYIFDHLINVQSRKDVEVCIERENVYFIVDIPDLLPHIDVIKAAFPSAKLIHVVRNAYQVAAEVYEKKWYSMEALCGNLTNGCIYRKYTNDDGDEYKIPAWVPRERMESFINGTDRTKSLLYWIYILNSIHSKNIFDMTVKYEDYTSYPSRIPAMVKKIASFVWSSKTDSLINEVHTNNRDVDEEIFLDQLSEEDRNTFYQLMEEYGYEFS